MSLILLVAQDQWQEFDAAWSAHLREGGALDDILLALRLVGEKKRLPRCLPLVREHVESLRQAERPADAARLLGAALLAGASPGELWSGLVESAEAAWSGEAWWAAYSGAAGFAADASDPRGAWASLERLLAFQIGSLVFHSAGWGVGEVEEIALDPAEIAIRLQSGRRDRFPLAAAADIFEGLPEGDLRAIRYRDPERLRKLVRTEPLTVLRALLLRHGGRATTTSIKNGLLQVGIEGSAWSTWWRRARKEAEADAWFRVTGTTARGEVQLLPNASDPVADLARRLEVVRSLAELDGMVRDQIAGGGGDARVRESLLAILEERAADAQTPPQARLAAWIYLREERQATPAPLAEVLAAARAAPAPADPSAAPPLWALFQSLAQSRDQERCTGLLQETLGEAWIEEGLANLVHAPPGMARTLVEALHAAGRGEDLGRAYADLLARPLRAPEVLLALARLSEAGRLPGTLPTPVQRAQALVSLASYLHLHRRGDVQTQRTSTRLAEFLTRGDPSVLRTLLSGADHDALVSVQRAMQRGVDELIETQFMDIFMRAAPAPSRGPAPQFWENDRIWTTRKGLEKRRAELHLLREEKIPANQEAIGRAAGMGDLSENSEWEAAIEEQRNLTTRAAEIESELRRAELIENALLSEDIVSPGTTVEYRETASGERHRVRVLGPWDTDRGEDVVSYRAPLAAGLLGRRPGERAQVQLPGGTLDVEVLTVHPLPFD